MTDQPKELKFDNRWLDEMIQQGAEDYDCIDINDQFYWSDKTTKQTLIWSVSSDDWMKVFSALLNGADLTYPDNPTEIIEIFLASVCQNMSFCDEVANCISNDSNVALALQNFVQQNRTSIEGTSPTSITASQSTSNLLPVGYTCDEEHLCGMARWIVNNLHDSTMQLLQQLENATQPFEFIALFVDNVEVASYFGSVIELAAWLQDQLLEYYELAWSTTVEDSLTCDIYCEILPSCNVSLDGLISAYESAVTDSFSLPSVLDEANDLFDWMDALDYETATAKAVVGSFHYVILQIMRFGSAAINYTSGMRSLKQMIATGADETDTYCETNCGCATAWCYEWDFESAQGGWTASTLGAAATVYVASNGFTGSGSNADRAAIFRDFGTTLSGLTQIEVWIRPLSTGVTNGLAAYDTTATGSQLIPPGEQVSPNVANTVGDYRQLLFNTPPDFDTFFYLTEKAGSFSTPQVYITKVVFHGEGTAPTLSGGTAC